MDPDEGTFGKAGWKKYKQIDEGKLLGPIGIGGKVKYKQCLPQKMINTIAAQRFAEETNGGRSDIEQSMGLQMMRSPVNEDIIATNKEVLRQSQLASKLGSNIDHHGKCTKAQSQAECYLIRQGERDLNPGAQKCFWTDDYNNLNRRSSEVAAGKQCQNLYDKIMNRENVEGNLHAAKILDSNDVQMLYNPGTDWKYVPRNKNLDTVVFDRHIGMDRVQNVSLKGKTAEDPTSLNAAQESYNDRDPLFKMEGRILPVRYMDRLKDAPFPKKNSSEQLSKLYKSYNSASDRAEKARLKTQIEALIDKRTKFKEKGVAFLHSKHPNLPALRKKLARFLEKENELVDIIKSKKLYYPNNPIIQKYERELHDLQSKTIKLEVQINKMDYDTQDKQNAVIESLTGGATGRNHVVFFALGGALLKRGAKKKLSRLTTLSSPQAMQIRYANPETLRFARFLHQKHNVSLGVLTNTRYSQAQIERMLDALGIRNLFSKIVVSSGPQRQKPNQNVFSWAEKGAPPNSKFWYVGNRYSEDIFGPSQAGWTAIHTKQLQNPHNVLTQFNL